LFCSMISKLMRDNERLSASASKMIFAFMVQL
jgi:hypothetical protein